MLGETSLECALRETAEEIDLNITDYEIRSAAGKRHVSSKWYLMANSIHHSHNYLFWYKSNPSAYLTTYIPVIDVRHIQQIDARTKEFKPKFKPIANTSTKEFKSSVNVDSFLDNQFKAS